MVLIFGPNLKLAVLIELVLIKKSVYLKGEEKKTEILEKIPWRGFGSERQCTKG